MKKIKIIAEQNYSDLEYKTNSYMTTRNIVDIQYRVHASGFYRYSVMVVYEED